MASNAVVARVNLHPVIHYYTVNEKRVLGRGGSPGVPGNEARPSNLETYLLYCPGKVLDIGAISRIVLAIN